MWVCVYVLCVCGGGGCVFFYIIIINTKWKKFIIIIFSYILIHNIRCQLSIMWGSKYHPYMSNALNKCLRIGFANGLQLDTLITSKLYANSNAIVLYLFEPNIMLNRNNNDKFCFLCICRCNAFSVCWKNYGFLLSFVYH